MASNARGLRLLKAIDYFSTKSTFAYFDKSSILSKVRLQSASNGSIKGSFVVDKSMCNFGGVLHGGYIAAVIDVLSYYTQITPPNGRVSYTTSMNVNYVAAADEGENVIVETKTLKSGNSAIVEMYFHNEKGILLVKGTTTFLAAGDKYQKLLKECIGFDVYED